MRRAGWLVIVEALVDPRRATTQVAEFGAPRWTLLVVLAVAVVLGLSIVPRQLALLAVAVEHTGFGLEAYRSAMHAGLRRLVVADRLVPEPTLLLACLCGGWAATAVLGASGDRTEAVWAVMGLGLAPIVLGRLGEALFVAVAPAGGIVSPGDAVTLPHRFVTGPLLAWRLDTPPPAWLELVDARVNLVGAWCVVIWATGLRVLEGGRWRVWHVLLPVVAMTAAGLVTWLLGPMTVAAILRIG
jgi:hypothetical protein